MADRDQAAAEADQRISDRDQAVSDREWEAYPSEDPGRLRAHEEAEEGRGEGTMARMATAAIRIQVASERHEQAQRRDEVAQRRDEIAAHRDYEAERADEAAEELAGQLGRDSPAAKVAAVARATAAAARTSAARDRERAARDREDAARDRELLMVEIERSHIDEVTGAYGRRMGAILVKHEIARATRQKAGLILCFVDVDKLKQVNDRDGHPAGDALLRQVFAALRAGLRPYDPIVRWGGDEFVCTMSDASVEDAQRLLATVHATLSRARPSGSVSAGLAALRDDDTLASLVERADAAMRESRRGR
jgi:diguanylate cyclase (GGDEF)-like protein